MSSYKNFCSLCLSVCVLCFCNHGNTPLYLNQMKLDLHKTFSISSVWSPKLINKLCGHARACIHAQRVKTCTRARQPETLRELACLHSYLRLHTSDLKIKKNGPSPGWSSQLINNVCGRARENAHATWAV